MTTTKVVHSFLVATGCAALWGCSSIPPVESSSPEPSQQPSLILPLIVSSNTVKNPPEIVAEMPLSLVAILWKMATTEKEALPKQILPYFGINDVPAVKVVREGYGWFAIDHQPPRFINEKLEQLGVKGLFYSYSVEEKTQRTKDTYSISLPSDVRCISANQAVSYFGQNFKRLPARIKTAAPTLPGFQRVKSAQTTVVEKGSLQFEVGLFDGRGSIIFQFDSQPCAEEVFINYTRKN